MRNKGLCSSSRKSFCTYSGDACAFPPQEGPEAASVLQRCMTLLGQHSVIFDEWDGRNPNHFHGSQEVWRNNCHDLPTSMR